MGGGSTSSDQDAANQAAQQLIQQLDDYCSFSLQSLAQSAPVLGSAVHDNDIKNQVRSTLTDWRVLLESDAQAIKDISDVFVELDAELANSVLGIGA
ncbi:MAG: hypothetical protein LBC35_02920 [Coriobacteriales bacterium]|jgi:hypothetical protein|nr:hypothetical protein [Coriobacteriales bacterium]